MVALVHNDEWHSAGVFFVDQHGNLIAQLRDGNTKRYPHKANVFGGRVEPSDTSFRAAAAREASEETNRKITPDDLELLLEYTVDQPEGLENLHTFVSYGHTTEGLEVYEGKGFYVISDPDDPVIADTMRPGVTEWFRKKALDARYRSA